MSDFRTGPVMLCLAFVIVAFVIVQSLFFMMKAWKRGKQLGIETAKMKQTMVSSALFSVAPAISILATVFALASALGYVLPWIRLSVIGNLAYETVAATNALEALGSSITATKLTHQEFSTVAWAMTIGASFPLFLLPILCKKLHKFTNKMLSGKEEAAETDNNVAAPKKKVNFGDVIGAAAFIGIMAAFISKSIMGIEVAQGGVSAGFMSVTVLVASMVFTVALDLLCQKKQLTKLEPFVLPIAMFGAMGIAVLLTQVLPADITEFTWRSILENGDVVWGVK